MSKLSRVERYQELRKKISEMDDYSFETSNEKERIEEVQENKIKQSTLSFSIDEMISESSQSKVKKKNREARKIYNQQMIQAKSYAKKFSLKILVWFLIGLVIIGLIIIVILVFAGVFTE